jgi:hypothetical protein
MPIIIIDDVLIGVISGPVGFGTGWVLDRTVKRVNGKQEVDDYMRKTYGDHWWKIK